LTNPALNPLSFSQSFHMQSQRPILGVTGAMKERRQQICATYYLLSASVDHYLSPVCVRTSFGNSLLLPMHISRSSSENIASVIFRSD